MIIINLTQHPATPEQVAAGVLDLKGDALEELKRLLTFDVLPTRGEIEARAVSLVDLAVFNGLGTTEWGDPWPDAVMIGGAPYLMGPLERALLERFIKPLYAFSTREVEEQVQPDRSVRKVAVFRHKGFVEVPIKEETW